MSIFSDISNITSKKRKLEVPKPKTNLFVRGIVLFALGLLGASVYTVEDIDKTPALVFLCIGAAFIIAGIIPLICYGKQVTAFKKYTPTWEKHRSIFDDFAIELNHWYDSDMRPCSCDGDTSYILRLQKDRMARKGIRMIQHTSPVKRETMGTTRVPRKTSWYTVDLMYEGVDRHLQFQNSTGTIYERVTEDTMYETVVHTPNEQELTRMSMTCPNCGAVSPVAALTEGCPYCRTVFRISDLFPRVTNIFFIRENASTKNQKKMGKTTGITMLVFFLACFIPSFLDRETPIPQALLMSFFVALIMGGIFGYIISIILWQNSSTGMDEREFRSGPM